MLLPQIRPISEDEEELTLLSGLASRRGDPAGRARASAGRERDRAPHCFDNAREQAGRRASVGHRRTPAGDMATVAGAAGDTPAQAANLAAELCAPHGHGRDRGQVPSRRARRAGARGILRALAATRSSSSRSSPRLAGAPCRARLAVARRTPQPRHPRRSRAPGRGAAAGTGHRRRRDRLDPGDGGADARGRAAAARARSCCPASIRISMRKAGRRSCLPMQASPGIRNIRSSV